MKKILEQIQNARQELINAYFETKKKYDEADKFIKENLYNLKQGANYDDAKMAEACTTKENAGTKLSEIHVAINELGNALCHLGIETEIFWGK